MAPTPICLPSCSYRQLLDPLRFVFRLIQVRKRNTLFRVGFARVKGSPIRGESDFEGVVPGGHGLLLTSYPGRSGAGGQHAQGFTMCDANSGVAPYRGGTDRPTYH